MIEPITLSVESLAQKLNIFEPGKFIIAKKKTGGKS
jgi:hypothetical protein